MYRWPKRKKSLSLEEIVDVLICNKVDQQKICSNTPIHVHHNVVFVVDLQRLDTPNDIKADENGVWKRKGSPVTYISVHGSGESRRIFRRTKLGTTQHHYKVSRTYYRHSTSPDFSRLLVTVHSE